MIYEWDGSLGTGDERIDSQHKQLLAAINDITEAHRQGKGKEEIEKTLDFLAGYAILHFSDEEKLMLECKYSEYTLHKRYHDEFKETVGKLIKRLASEEVTDDLVSVVISTLGDWLFSHIKGEDFRMAAYSKSFCK